MNSSDESPAVAELPDDAIEVLIDAIEAEVLDAMERVHYAASTFTPVRNVLQDMLTEVYPLIAARVRAEAQPVVASVEVAAARNPLLGTLYLHESLDFSRELVGAFERAVRAEAVAELEDARLEGYEAGHDQGYDEGSELSESQIAAACAEAVADERQRIKGRLEQLIAAETPGLFSWTAWRVAALQDALKIVAAGSVPVATPELCGWWDGPEGHVYGICNQPKGHQGRRHAETLADGTHWAGWGGGNRPPAPATRGTATDPWSAPGPVATPTEPPRERLAGWFDVTELVAGQPPTAFRYGGAGRYHRLTGDTSPCGRSALGADLTALDWDEIPLDEMCGACRDAPRPQTEQPEER